MGRNKQISVPVAIYRDIERLRRELILRERKFVTSSKAFEEYIRRIKDAKRT